ncbi:MAG TPA: ABC transporter substrate-binding protein [Stellaceae bacterium]|nr:ABC transporter substrate-binding protein [Stellaceae bacterium]
MRGPGWLAIASSLLVAAAFGGGAKAAGTYDPGATDTTITIGNSAPYSGNLSATSMGSKVATAYFKMLNDKGGINGRKIIFKSYDDGYNPARTVEQVRRLVEEDQVLLVFSIPGTPTNLAVERYLNQKKVPQLFAAAGASRLHDYEHYPYTVGFIPSYVGEGTIYGRYIAANMPDAKIGVLRQDDDYGRDFLDGLERGLADKAKAMIVADVTYQPTDPAVYSQVATLQGSGATHFVNITTPKFAAQAIARAYDIGWKPVQFLNSVSYSIGAVIEPAGPEKAKGVISAIIAKDFSDPAWANDPGVQEFAAFMKQYAPDFDPHDSFTGQGYIEVQLISEVLRRCGDNLTHENIMRVVTSLDHVTFGMLLPGISITLTPTNYNTIASQQLVRFDGTSWVRFDQPLSGL